MTMLGLLLVFLSVVRTSAQCGDVCYEDVGCFTNCPPYDVMPLPKSPNYINATFRLYTRQNPIDFDTISVNDLGSFEAKNTWFVTHGFLSRGSDPWFVRIKDELLIASDQNVIIIDWTDGARIDPDEPAVPYPSSNTRVVGRLASNLVKVMVAEKGLQEHHVACAGHSIGSHLCGFFGKEHTDPKIRRIVGLDPAGSFFDTPETQIRLSPTDAAFVDAIHTDAHGLFPFGTTINVGHQDFWPHRGDTQPGCPGATCSHIRVNALFAESINSECGFPAVHCNDFEDMWSGQCSTRTCSGEACGVMGYHAHSRPLQGTFYLETNSVEPFCNATLVTPGY